MLFLLFDSADAANALPLQVDFDDAPEKFVVLAHSREHDSTELRPDARPTPA
jgi:hypothetical protein